MKKIKWLKIIFFTFFVKPFVFIGLGLNIGQLGKLPKKGPAIIAANHTSHLDALVLMSLFPLSQLSNVRPVAAADYFLRNKWIAWFSIHCLDIVPMQRRGRLSQNDLFNECYNALDQDQIIILFPEGTRSLKEDRAFQLKRGIHLLAKNRPKAKVIPVLLRGLGKSLPKGEAILVPFNCDVMIDDVIYYHDDSEIFLKSLILRYEHLLSFCITSKSK